MKRILPFLVLGPISGPLVAGVVYNIKPRPILGSLYIAALASVTVALPSALLMLLNFLHSVQATA